MTLRSYEELAQEAGLSNMISGVPLESTLGKTLTMASTAMTNSMLQRLIIFGTFAWAIFLFFAVFPSIADGSIFLMIPLFCLGPLVIGAIVVSVYNFLLNTLLGTPNTQMSAIRLRRNDTLTVRYQQPIKRSMTLNSMAFSLILKESATYDQGTSTITATHLHVVDQKIDFQVPVAPDNGLDQHLSFKVPEDAMHTFEAYRNKLDWYLQVKLDIPKFPDFERTYELKVLSEVNHES